MAPSWGPLTSPAHPRTVSNHEVDRGFEPEPSAPKSLQISATPPSITKLSSYDQKRCFRNFSAKSIVLWYVIHSNTLANLLLTSIKLVCAYGLKELFKKSFVRTTRVVITCTQYSNEDQLRLLRNTWDLRIRAFDKEHLNVRQKQSFRTFLCLCFKNNLPKKYGMNPNWNNT